MPTEGQHVSDSAVPSATILPSVWIAAAVAPAWTLANFVSTVPSPPNDGSRTPFGRYRATTNLASSEPTARIFPLAWTATPGVNSNFRVKWVMTRPSRPNVVSSLPWRVYRARAHSTSGLPALPTATTFPSGWIEMPRSGASRSRRGDQSAHQDDNEDGLVPHARVLSPCISLKHSSCCLPSC